MLKRSERRRSDADNTGPSSHSHKLIEEQAIDGEKFSTIVAFPESASNQHRRETSSARSLSNLEAENAELRNTAVALRREIEHLHVVVDPGRGKPST